jgi:hypothetical protein
MLKVGNVASTYFSSGQLLSSLVLYWSDQILMSNVWNKFLLLSDASPAQSDEDIYRKILDWARLDIPKGSDWKMQPFMFIEIVKWQSSLDRCTTAWILTNSRSRWMCQEAHRNYMILLLYNIILTWYRPYLSRLSFNSCYNLHCSYCIYTRRCPLPRAITVSNRSKDKQPRIRVWRKREKWSEGEVMMNW